MVLDVPDPGEEWGQVLMAVHEGGVISWHLPRPTSDATDPTRGGAAVQFHVDLPELGPPVDDAARHDDEEATTRGLIGLAGRVLLKALVFPIAKEVAGRVTARLVRNWEEEHRPYGLRWFGPSDDPRAGTAIAQTDLADLAAGRALMLVHGTFSTSATGFGQLSDDAVGRLARAYDGRVFAFEHPSVATSPDDNLAGLQAALDGAPRLDLDVVTHSRGGLVGRLIAGGLGDVPQVQVRNLVFGATPNHGTLLAQPKHVVAFLDRATTLLNLAPPGPADIRAGRDGGTRRSQGHRRRWTRAPDRPDRDEPRQSVARGPQRAGRGRRHDHVPGHRRRLRAHGRTPTRNQDAGAGRDRRPGHGQRRQRQRAPTVGVTGTASDPAALVADPLVYATGDGVHHSNIFAKRRTHQALEEWLIGGATP